MIDIHTHITPGVDDGISTLEESMVALQKEQEEGVHTVVLTPHLTCGKSSIDDVSHLIQAMRRLKMHTPYLHLLMGCELMLNDDVKQSLASGIYIPIEGTHYLLCEGNVRKETSAFTECFDYYIQEVLAHGYTPIVCHIERYFHEGVDLDYIRYLKQLGAIMQANTTSLLSPNTSIVYQNTIALLDEQLIDIFASDTHQANGFRSPNFRQAVKVLHTLGFDKKYIEDLFLTNPSAIIHNQALLTKHYKSRSFLKKMRHKKVTIQW